MGYNTNFSGSFELDRPLKKKHAKYLRAFSHIRHMRRKEILTIELPDKLRKKVGLPIGVEGEYYVGSHKDGNSGQTRTLDVANGNSPSTTMPGLWCQWTVGGENGHPLEADEIEKGVAVTICWDQGEKFYYYVEWLQYIIDNFLKRWEYTLNGTVQWSGEQTGDVGKIVVTNNVIEIIEF